MLSVWQKRCTPSGVICSAVTEPSGRFITTALPLAFSVALAPRLSPSAGKPFRAMYPPTSSLKQPRKRATAALKSTMPVPSLLEQGAQYLQMNTINFSGRALVSFRKQATASLISAGRGRSRLAGFTRLCRVRAMPKTSHCICPWNSPWLILRTKSVACSWKPIGSASKMRSKVQRFTFWLMASSCQNGTKWFEVNQKEV
mmetsp:Transcript_69894/g.166813  ORF Transcript_69894/g.166813 Transcript_69894/m.166813 type:complete len:200 (-) Transcript_69894:820-1419(-)